MHLYHVLCSRIPFQMFSSYIRTRINMFLFSFIAFSFCVCVCISLFARLCTYRRVLIFNLWDFLFLFPLIPFICHFYSSSLIFIACEIVFVFFSLRPKKKQFNLNHFPVVFLQFLAHLQYTIKSHGKKNAKFCDRACCNRTSLKPMCEARWNEMMHHTSPKHSLIHSYFFFLLFTLANTCIFI